ncbi:MAG: peptidylprolyl isomerase [Candidatus Saccharicenans sp.]
MNKNLLIFLAIFLLFSVNSMLAANPKVLMKTSKGDIVIELYPDKAPITVNNFLAYVDEKFYDGTIFHRVIKGFMIQGGGLTPDLKTKSEKRPPIKNEAKNGLKNLRGTIAMARTRDIDSATCQFFINLVDNPFLDHVPDDPDKFGYAVFGKVVQGMEVVEAIANTPTTTKGMYRDVPVEPIVIISVTRVQ